MPTARYDEQRFALAAWDRAIVQGDLASAPIRRDVSQSWQRCLAAKLDPALPRAPLMLDEDGLSARRERPWFRMAEAALTPHIDAVADCGHVLTLFDADGCMLSSAGNPATLELLRGIQFIPGASWGENVAGTNGPGTALALRRPIHVIGAEHFCEAWHAWHCAAVPLIDPETGTLLGALDISGDERTAHPYALALAGALARTVEQALLIQSREHRASEPSPIPRRSQPPSRPEPEARDESAPVARRSQPPAASTRYELSDLLGSDPLLQEARRLARIASDNRLPVLILGESGVGKEVVAQAIHGGSARAARPFIAVNCGAIPAELVESELFGYVPGAFSGAQRAGAKGKFEAADGGTLFLDEICDLPLLAQAALLRVLQERQITPVGANQARPIDVRVIAATHRDPRVEMEAGRFRSDLYYRLNVLGISLPPLRARGADIIMLAGRFLQAAERETGHRVTLSPEVERALLLHDWPGNVRELENVMYRLSAISQHGVIELAELPPELRVSTPDTTAPAAIRAPDDASKHELISVIRGARTMAEAATRLGITRSTLYRRLERFGLHPSRWVGEIATGVRDRQR